MQPAQNKENIFTKITKFYQANHLEEHLKRMNALDKEGKQAQTALGNFRTLGLDLGGFFFNIVKTPFTTAAQPGGLIFRTGINAVDEVVHFTRLDSENAVFRRKLVRVLPKIISYVPSPADLGRTIVNVFRYALAFFASLTVGFISVDANIWVHHKLGLICNSDLVQEDRKEAILNAAQKTEGKSLKEDFKDTFTRNADLKAKQKLRNQVIGNNQYKSYKVEYKGHPIQERRIILDENCEFRKSMSDATQKKRIAAKEEIEKASGQNLTENDLERIKNKYWKNLSEPFDFAINDKLDADYQEFLSKYFNWKNVAYNADCPPCLSFKSPRHFEAYTEEYYKWNLTADEVKEIQRKFGWAPLTQFDAFGRQQGIEDLFDKRYIPDFLADDQIDAAYKEAENFLIEKSKKRQQKQLKKENKCAELDKRVANALTAKEEELNRKLTIQEISNVNETTKAVIEIERKILKLSQELKRNVAREEVDLLIKNHGYEFNPNETMSLQQFGLIALETLELREEDLKAAKTRPPFMPLEHYYELKNMSARELKREVPFSKFDRPVYNFKTNENIDPEVLASVEAALPLIEKEQIARMDSAWQEKGQDFNDPVFANKRLEAIEKLRVNLTEIEKPRLYEKLFLEKIFPAATDTRKIKKIKKERTVQFEGLEKARENAQDKFLNTHTVVRNGHRFNKEAIAAHLFWMCRKKPGALDENKDKSWHEGKLYQEWPVEKCFRVKVELKPKPAGNIFSNKNRYNNRMDDYSDSLITFERPLAKNEKDKFPQDLTFTYKQLDKAVKDRKKWFQECARKYKDKEDQIFQKIFGPKGKESEFINRQYTFLKLECDLYPFLEELKERRNNSEDVDKEKENLRLERANNQVKKPELGHLDFQLIDQLFFQQQLAEFGNANQVEGVQIGNPEQVEVIETIFEEENQLPEAQKVDQPLEQNVPVQVQQ